MALLLIADPLHQNSSGTVNRIYYVIPAQAGIHKPYGMDPRLRGGDKPGMKSPTINHQ
jgi:hypothetical protein